MSPSPRPTTLGPHTNLSLIASPYALHKLVLITCAKVKAPNIDELFFVLITLLIVLKGEPAKITNKPEANNPKTELIVVADAPDNPKNVHKHNVEA